MKLLPLFLLCAITQDVVALPPVNDLFATRTIVGSVASYSVTTTNVDATVQTSNNENTLSNLMGATIWWQWTAPASGWVRMDTYGSAVDTILKVTSSIGPNGTLFGYNDDEISGYGESSISFQATSGTIYYIAIGGYNNGTTVDKGAITFNISMAPADRPPNWPSALTFSPTSANVRTADVNVTATITVAGDAGATGDVDLYFRRGTGNTIYPPVVSYTSFTSGSVNAVNVVTFPRYLFPGTWAPLIDLFLDDGTTLEFGNADSGRPYLIPVATTLAVTNTGTTDVIAPAVTAFSITPTSVNANSAAVNVSVSAALSDVTSGVKVLQAYLYHPTNDAIFLPLTLVRTSGTIANEVWTGTTSIPKEYPSEAYSVYLYVQDNALNESDYGEYGTLDFPGTAPLIDVTVLGGGPYWEWAYENIYPYSDDVDLSLDPNEDGLDNLTCYAFGLDPLDPPFLDDLPTASITGTTAKSLTFEFWRRVGASGVTYTPQICDNLQSANWVNFPGTAALINGDTEWEYMRMIDTGNTTTKPTRFARMRLTYIDN